MTRATTNSQTCYLVCNCLIRGLKSDSCCDCEPTYKNTMQQNVVLEEVVEDDGVVVKYDDVVEVVKTDVTMQEGVKEI